MRKVAACVVVWLSLVSRALADEVVWFVSAEDKEAWAQDLAERWSDVSGNHVKWIIGNHSDGTRMVASGMADLALSNHANLVTPKGDVRPSERDITTLPLFFDAVAFVVNNENPLTSVAASQLKMVLRDSEPNWSQLNGSTNPISIYIPKYPFAGDRLLLQKWVWGSFWHDWSDQVKTNDSTTDIAKKSNQIENILGISSLYTTRRASVRSLKLDDVELSYQTVKSGLYPLVYPVYLAFGNSKLAKELSYFALDNKNSDLFIKNEIVLFNEPAAQAQWQKLSLSWRADPAGDLFKTERAGP